MMAAVLCAILGYVVGPIGVGVATAAVIMLGGAAALGKVSWGMALTICMGLTITFGCSAIALGFGIVSPCI